MTRRRLLRWGALLGGLAALQAAAVALYLQVERGRSPPPPSFRYDPLAGDPLPPLDLEDARGRRARLHAAGRATLVHLWATWCAPCRTELPALLALDGASIGAAPLRVVAVSTEPSWSPLRAFFGGEVPRPVRLGGPAASRALGVRALPETFLVDGAGRLRARFRGPRDWSAPEAGAGLAALLARSR